MTRWKEFNTKNFNSLTDAAQVIRVLLRFLLAHPDLTGNEVILVGESYGGTRVSTMLTCCFSILTMVTAARYTGTRHWWRKFRLSSKPSFQKDKERRLLRKRLRNSSPDKSSWNLSSQAPIRTRPRQNSFATRVRSSTKWPTKRGRFSSRALPCRNVCTDARPTRGHLSFLEHKAKRDAYNVMKPAGYTDELEAFSVAGLSSVEILSTVLGTDVTQINLLSPSSRSDAYRFIFDGDGYILEGVAAALGAIFFPERAATLDASRSAALAEEEPEDSLGKVLGTLEPWDGYLVGTNTAVYATFIYLDGAMLAGYNISADRSPIYGKCFCRIWPSSIHI